MPTQSEKENVIASVFRAIALTNSVRLHYHTIKGDTIETLDLGLMPDADYLVSRAETLAAMLGLVMTKASPDWIARGFVKLKDPYGQRQHGMFLIVIDGCQPTSFPSLESYLAWRVGARKAWQELGASIAEEMDRGEAAAVRRAQEDIAIQSEMAKLQQGKPLVTWFGAGGKPSDVAACVNHAYLAERFDTDETNLWLLAEEAGEVVRSCGKIGRWGYDHVHQITGESGMRLLEAEAGDFLAIVEIMVARGHFTREGLRKALFAKLERLENWYDPAPTPTDLDPVGQLLDETARREDLEVVKTAAPTGVKPKVRVTRLDGYTDNGWLVDEPAQPCGRMRMVLDTDQLIWVLWDLGIGRRLRETTPPPARQPDPKPGDTINVQIQFGNVEECVFIADNGRGNAMVCRPNRTAILAELKDGKWQQYVTDPRNGGKV